MRSFVTLWRIKCAASIHAAPWRGDGIHECGGAGAHARANAGPTDSGTRGRVGPQCGGRDAPASTTTTTAQYHHAYCKSISSTCVVLSFSILQTIKPAHQLRTCNNYTKEISNHLY